jgi:predicted polyphosphate/ATP-dependent NAD kinase
MRARGGTSVTVTAVLHIGLIVNPLAGLGGSLALKGSDGPEIRELAARGHAHRAQERTLRMLKILQQDASAFQFSSARGAMGETSLAKMGLAAKVVGSDIDAITTSEDTRVAAEALRQCGVDIIVFAGGDGTARDIYDAVGDECPVLGLPTGVKMHSGVFAVSPEAAGELLLQLARGGLVGLSAQEVRDIDEDAFREDTVRTRFYGELRVPSEGRFLQQTKVGGREVPELAAADIAAWLAMQMEPERLYFIGPGSTTAAIMTELKLPNTLLGVDIVGNGLLLSADVNEEQLLEMVAQSPGQATIVVTVIGGQGYFFGRGNQQFSPSVIRAVGLENIWVVAAKSKLASLDGRPLLVDTNDKSLDLELCGYRTVVTGYDDQTLYRVSDR